MSNLADWFTRFEAAYGDIEAVVLHNIPGSESRYINFNIPEDKCGIPLMWDDDTLKLIDKEFDEGYGSESAPHFFVYGKNHIMIKQEYDGYESPLVIPRHPEVHNEC